MLVITRLIGILAIITATVIVALGIFGVFSGNEIKDSLQKILELAGVVIVACALVTLLNKPKS